MLSNVSKGRQPESDRIDMSDPHQIREWLRHWGIREEQLKEVVEEAGVMITDIKALLKRRGFINQFH